MSSVPSLSPLSPFQQILQEVLHEAEDDHTKIKTVINTTNLNPPGDQHMRLRYVSCLSDNFGYHLHNNNALKETERRIIFFMQFKKATLDQTIEMLGFLKSRKILDKTLEKAVNAASLIALIKSYCGQEQEELTLSHTQEFLEEKPCDLKLFAETRSFDPFNVKLSVSIPGTIIGEKDPITETAHIHIRRALPNPEKEKELLDILKKENEASSS